MALTQHNEPVCSVADKPRPRASETERGRKEEQGMKEVEINLKKRDKKDVSGVREGQLVGLNRSKDDGEEGGEGKKWRPDIV